MLLALLCLAELGLAAPDLAEATILGEGDAYDLCRLALITSLNSTAASLLDLSDDDSALKRLAYSGKGPNDLGHYRACLAMGSSRYYTIELMAFGVSAVTGFCSPLECSKDDIQGLINSRPGGLLYKDSYIYLQVHEDTSYTLSTGGFIVLLLLFTSLLLALIGSYWDYTADNKALSSLDKPSPPKMTFLRCFSLYSNVNKLFDSRSADTSSATAGLAVLNGVRVISISWVILGHCLAFRAGNAIINIDSFTWIGKQFWTAIGYGGFYAVDSFFWLSGFLLCYLTLQEIERRRGDTSPVFWGTLYLHRFLRLLPLYSFSMAFSSLVLPSLGSGPLWWQMEYFTYDCKEYWWTNFLFINNFVPDGFGNGCFGIGWYLSNDMQFFWIAPIFIVLYRNSPSKSWAAVTAAICGTIFITCSLAEAYDYNPVVIAAKNTENRYFERLYTKPYCRAVPFLLGLLVGFVYTQYLKTEKGEAVTDQLAGKVIWVYKEYKHGAVVSLGLGVALVMFFIFIQMTIYDSGPNWDGWSKSSNVLFIGFRHFFFSLGLILILLPVLLNELPFMLTILGGKFWTPLARISFAAFMCHFALMMYILKSEQTGVIINGMTLFHDFVGTVLLTFSVALPLSMLVEVPFLNLEKLLNGRRR
jgi:peptidoglycan/LPS O-acetylase OafA/YrhL